MGQGYLSQIYFLAFHNCINLASGFLDLYIHEVCISWYQSYALKSGYMPFIFVV